MYDVMILSLLVWQPFWGHQGYCSKEKSVLWLREPYDTTQHMDLQDSMKRASPTMGMNSQVYTMLDSTN